MEQGIRASKIEELLIDGNPILDGDSHHANESLLRLASLMPNLTSFGFRIDNIDEGVVPNYKLQSFLDWRKYGDEVARTHKPVPLSLWPLIFERVSQHEDRGCLRPNNDHSKILHRRRLEITHKLVLQLFNEQLCRFPRMIASTRRLITPSGAESPTALAYTLFEDYFLRKRGDFNFR